MEIIKVDAKKPAVSVLKKAAAIILGGGVVVYPTDTAYGMAVNALDEEPIGKLFIIKHRIQKPLPVIVNSKKMLEKIAEVTPAENKLMKKYWPGALTIIFKKKKTIPPSLTLGLPTIGVRMPNSVVATSLIKYCNKPLTSTSANVTGQGNCYTPECVIKMFRNIEMQPDLILDAGELPEVPVSTVVQVEDNKIKVIRKGPIKVKK